MPKSCLQDHLLTLCTGPVGDADQQVLWALCLLQRKQPIGQTQLDVARMMAVAGQQQFGRALNLRFPTGLSLSFRVTVEQLNQLLQCDVLQLLDGGRQAAAGVRGRPLEESDPSAAAQVAAAVMTDAMLDTSGSRVDAYRHGCQLGDASFAVALVRMMRALEYAE